MLNLHMSSDKNFVFFAAFLGKLYYLMKYRDHNLRQYNDPY